MLTITGYPDRISVRPGETIKFMVNCEHPTYQADIVRLICADDTPAGPDFKERPIRTPVSKRHKGRRQVIHAGSYALVESRPLLETLGSFTVQAMIWPTTPGKGEQGIVTKWDPRSKAGFALVIDEAKAPSRSASAWRTARWRRSRSASRCSSATGIWPPRATTRSQAKSLFTRSRSCPTRASTTAARRSAKSALRLLETARRSSWPAPSSGARRATRWWTASTTARSIRPVWSAALWIAWRSSA